MIALTNPKHDVQAYIDGVTSGDIVAGKLVRLAVQRHVSDLKHAHARGWRFDVSAASKAVLFFPACCRHSIGEWDGEPFVLSPWQAFVVWVLFGWRNIQTGYRRFRKAFLSVARKNGKTTMVAGLGLLLMFMDTPFEAGCEIYCAATKEDQAKILYREAVRMVEASSDLDALATIRKSRAEIAWEENHSTFKPLGSDSKGMDGLNPHGVLLDELHAWREQHRQLKEKLETGGGARRQPLEIIITTAGDDKSQLWIEEDAFAVKVLESVISGNVIDDTTFAYICRIDEEDDPFNEDVWPKANPNYDVSVKPQYLRDQANEAKHKPTTTNQFLRYHCNVKVGSTERAISAEMWAKGNEPLITAAGAQGFGGIDLGRSDDWCAIGGCFPVLRPKLSEEDDGISHWEIRAKAWTSKDGEFPVTAEPYRSWIKDGLLECSSGNQVDFAAVKQEIRVWSDLYNITNWAFDPNFATAPAQDWQEDIGIELYRFYQTPKYYNEPVRRFLSELKAGRIRHGNEPVLGWQAGNLTIRRNAKDEWMPEKGQKLHKIDGMIAVLMAFAGCIVQPETAYWSPEDGV
jgi:phage terminase large subunit-like protein